MRCRLFTAKTSSHTLCDAGFCAVQQLAEVTCQPSCAQRETEATRRRTPVPGSPWPEFAEPQPRRLAARPQPARGEPPVVSAEGTRPVVVLPRAWPQRMMYSLFSRLHILMSRPLTTQSPEYLSLSPRRRTAFNNLQARTMEGGGGWRYAPGGDLTSTGMLTTRPQNAGTLEEVGGKMKRVAHSLHSLHSDGPNSPADSSRLPQYQHMDMALTQSQLFLGSTVGRGEDRSGLMSRSVTRQAKNIAPPTALETLMEARRLATGEVARTDLFMPMGWPLRTPRTSLEGCNSCGRTRLAHRGSERLHCWAGVCVWYWNGLANARLSASLPLRHDYIPLHFRHRFLPPD